MYSGLQGCIRFRVQGIWGALRALGTLQGDRFGDCVKGFKA